MVLVVYIRFAQEEAYLDGFRRGYVAAEKDIVKRQAEAEEYEPEFERND